MVRGAETPERRCLVTREVKAREQMIRFVLDPTGQVVPDVDARLPGRGMWLSADRNVLNRAIAANLFARSACARVQAAVNLTEQVERLRILRLALDDRLCDLDGLLHLDRKSVV